MSIIIFDLRKDIGITFREIAVFTSDLKIFHSKYAILNAEISLKLHVTRFILQDQRISICHIHLEWMPHSIKAEICRNISILCIAGFWGQQVSLSISRFPNGLFCPGPRRKRILPDGCSLNTVYVEVYAKSTPSGYENKNNRSRYDRFFLHVKTMNNSTTEWEAPEQ